MPNAFDFSSAPFDGLSAEERQLVAQNVDIAYYREGDVLLAPGVPPTHLFVIIKGHVTQWSGDEHLATYGPQDCFDGRALLAGQASDRFVAAEEVVTYELRHETVTHLIAANASFGAYLFSDLGEKLGTLAQMQNQREMQSLTLSRVDEAFVRPAAEVLADDDIVSVVRVMHTQQTNAVLVRDTTATPERVGIFSTNALQRAVLDGRPLDQLPVRSFSNFDLVTVQPSDQIGDAMALMLSRRVHRVVVSDKGRISGILEALDLFSFLSNHSHLLSLQIENAEGLPGLQAAAGKITQMIAVMQRSGMRVGLIAKLVQQLNAQLFERAWTLIAPPELVANSCLFVMGSEGRGEQLLKTDQDNGLIWRDGYTPPDDLPAICQRFSEALSAFGYPECPGHIMVNNPAWRGPQAETVSRVREWLIMPTSDSLMKLAIFMDSHAVCGDHRLLEQVRLAIAALTPSNEIMVGRFAAVIMSFGDNAGWFNRLFTSSDARLGMDIKREGTFPLVHGVRSLAFARNIHETNTADRIQALVADGSLEAPMGNELTESLAFFMGLKLKAGLLELDMDKPVSGRIDIQKLTGLERELLKDTLGVVRRFKDLLKARFHLDAM